MKKMMRFIPILILAAALLAGCASRQEAQEESWLEDFYAVPHLVMHTLTEDNYSELERYTALESVDFADNTCYDLITRYAADHPQVDVTYRVDLGGTVLTNDTAEAELTASSFTYELLLENLAYLPELRSLALPRTDLEGAQLLALREAWPEKEITWTVELQQQEYAWDTESLMLDNADAQALALQLERLPMVRDVTFGENPPENAAIAQLKTQYPEICFHWAFELMGIPVHSDSTEIDLSGISMDSVAELEESLQYFNSLQKVVMCDTGLPSEEIDGLWKRHPETRFVWNVKIGRFWVRTDITYLMPYQYGYYGTDSYGRLKDKDCGEMKYLVDMVCLDMGHMHITDISFVRYMPELTYFIIGDSRVTDLSPLAGAPKLKYLEAFFSGVTDISPLAQCLALEDVNICHNQIRDFSALMSLPALQHIWIAGNKISDEQKAQLEQAHPDAVIVYNLVGSTGAGWREIPNYYAQRDFMGMPYMKGG